MMACGVGIRVQTDTDLRMKILPRIQMSGFKIRPHCGNQIIVCVGLLFEQ